MKNIKIGIIGLGYVGLPLAVEFGRKFSTVGYDINEERLKNLNNGFDSTNEVSNEKLLKSLRNGYLSLENNINNLRECNVYIITVPTPIDENNNPNLIPLITASKEVGKILKKEDVVIYESTVYPGCTEEDCVPILEKNSKLKFNKDFFCGYSPERINPGDKKHTLTNILKVTSGSNKRTSKFVDNLYREIIKAGTYLAPSIKVAEAAKIIENSQRDINIAFMNELSKIFNLLEINTNEVLKAASTKWNFLNFKPGLVGGHCIGVDPYYLAQKAKKVGYNPEIILSGRRINDGMSGYVVNQFIRAMIKKRISVPEAKILILGLTFKENCPDTRNTRVVEIINYLKELNQNITICDPVANKNEVKEIYNIDIVSSIPKKKFDCIMVSVPHNEFKTIDYFSLTKKNHVLYDLKGITNIYDSISL